RFATSGAVKTAIPKPRRRFSHCACLQPLVLMSRSRWENANRQVAPCRKRRCTARMNKMIRPSEATDSRVSGRAPFVHLKVHSAYSLLEGALTIPRLAKLAVGNGFPALGLTDTSNLFGALEFSDKLA